MQDYHGDAEVYQNLSGAAAQENPYLPFLKPKVVERGGKRYLRIPKNQELMKLGEFFDTHNDKEFKNTNQLAQTYLDFIKTRYDVNKPYFKSTAPKPKKVGKFKMEKTDTGGLRFTQDQGDGSYKPITAAEYALLSGNNVLDLLAQDPTPNSQKVIDDTRAIEEKINSGEISAEDGLDALIKAYPYVYGSS